MPEGLTLAAFDRLGRSTTGPEAISSCGRFVDAMLAKVNRSLWAAKFSAMRTRFGLNGGDAFLTAGNYVHGSPGHWYVFHRNGRWEPQFNIAMYGRGNGHQAYLRVGLGMSLNLASADPDREAGLRQLRSLFMNLQWMAKYAGRPLLLTALSIGEPVAEAQGVAVPSRMTADAIANWLPSVDGQQAAWIFVGRKLACDTPEHAELLADFDNLLFEITRTLDVWLPVWEAVMRGDGA